MKATELRLGNLIRFNDLIQPEKIVVIDGYFFWSFRDGKYDVSNYYHPIPLTEERLLKMGNAIKGRFPNEVDIYDRFRFIWKESYKYWYVVTIESKEYLTKIEFVHEYQNFIFALTGEEL